MATLYTKDIVAVQTLEHITSQPLPIKGEPEKRLIPLIHALLVLALRWCKRADVSVLG